LVFLITNDYTNKESKKRISLRKPAMANLTIIIKCLEVSINTKVKLLKTTFFPAMLFGCKGKQVIKRPIPWTVRRMNAPVTDKIMTQAISGKFGHNQQIEIIWA